MKKSKAILWNDAIGPSTLQVEKGDEKIHFVVRQGNQRIAAFEMNPQEARMLLIALAEAL